MLKFKDKVLILEKYLLIKEDSYADLMKDELYFYFFINAVECNFLKTLFDKKDIINKIDFVISKMILHEHEDSTDQIIENYLST